MVAGDVLSGTQATPGLRERLVLRARLYALIRAFFAQRGVLEVETPMLSAAANTDPNIASFRTRFHGHADAGPATRWLRTSPEFPLKRLLAAGLGDCYELGRVFRDGEAGGRHNPEFTLLEWYRVGWDARRLALEVAELVQAALASIAQTARVEVLTYAELFARALGVDAHGADVQTLRAALGGLRVHPEGLDRDDWLDLLLTHRIQPLLPAGLITVVHDYPASQCALARVRPGDPPVAARFEVYLGAFELANGYHELNDAAEQRRRFRADNARRRARGLPAMPRDENLLAALGDLPDCSGVALGVDRLLMGMAGAAHIGEVLAFDFARA